MVRIKHIDPTCLEILEGTNIVKKILGYRSEIWLPAQWGRRKRVVQKHFVSKGGKKSYCPAGFLDRIKQDCKRQNIEFCQEGEVYKLSPYRKPILPGVTFRPIQLDAITSINENQIGIINAATGIGKSIFAAGLISTYKDPSVLFLCRSIDLVNQAYETFTSFGLNPCKLGNGSKKITSDIVISTTQTFKLLPLIQLSDMFDIVIADEAHKGSNRGGEYDKILSRCMAPIRVGLTATMPSKIENALLIEGLLGPVRIKADTTYGIEEGILAKPTIEFLVVPEGKSISALKTYRDIYKKAIVENNTRHRIIALAVLKEIADNNSCLLFCTEIEHINNLSRIFSENKISHECVFGDVKSDERTKIKKRLEDKKNLVVISSVVWAEGLDIKSLNCLFNISGGKSSEVIIQKAGRALRVDGDKTTATIYDCLDQSKHLSGHTVKRMIVYKSLGWI